MLLRGFWYRFVSETAALGQMAFLKMLYNGAIGVKSTDLIRDRFQ